MGSGSESGKRKEASAGCVYRQVTAVGGWPLGVSGGLRGTLLRAVPRSGQGAWIFTFQLPVMVSCRQLQGALHPGFSGTLHIG